MVFRARWRPAVPRAGGGPPHAEAPALVRLSCTFGFPRPLPDWVGLGVRIDGGDDHDDLDLLLVSSADVPSPWRQMRPTREALRRPFTSVTRYPLGRPGWVVVATPAAPRSGTLADLSAGASPCPVTYRLEAAESPGSRRPLGELVLVERVDGDVPGLRFRPPDDGGAVVAPLRRRVYAWSQKPDRAAPVAPAAAGP
ncbi:MAG TPA: hypothetical protein VF743_02460 [Acidimicrobiales bacterium]